MPKEVMSQAELEDGLMYRAFLKFKEDQKHDLTVWVVYMKGGLCWKPNQVHNARVYLKKANAVKHHDKCQGYARRMGCELKIKGVAC